MRGVVPALMVFLLVAACSSGTRRSGTEALEMLRLAGSREIDPPRDGSELFVIDTVPVPADRAFGAVRGAYSTMGISFSFFEPQRLRLGGFVRSLQDLGDEPPSTWFDCGRGIVDTYAERYQVSAVIATRVMPLGSANSTIETVIRGRALARDVSASALRCRSLGTIEQRIADLVRRGAIR